MAIKKIKDSSGTEHVIDATLWNGFESPEAMGLLSGVKNITYSELVGLRDNSNLATGQQYRITDYMTTTKQRNTQSAGHQFDIIVTADSNNTLNEVARACKHVNDTYFATENLSAWQIWYCLDNDIERFGWADTTNGKGVIYRMIDEYNNECPYDFRNIMFKKYLYYNEETSSYLIMLTDEEGEEADFSDNEFITVKSQFCYTFAYENSDVSILGNNTLYNDAGNINGVYNNIIKKCLSYSEDYGYEGCQVLNNIVFYNCYADDEDWYSGFNGNVCGYNCYDIYFNGPTCGEGNIIGSNCSNIYFKSCGYYNTFGDNCHRNIFGDGCHRNTFGNSCFNNTFGNNCCENTFGNNCDLNTFGNECSYNTFGNSCSVNTFGVACTDNYFGSDCRYNTFGNYCNYNTLKTYYRRIIFDNGNS